MTYSTMITHMKIIVGKKYCINIFESWSLTVSDMLVVSFSCRFAGMSIARSIA